MSRAISNSAYGDFGAGDLNRRVTLRCREDHAVGYSSIATEYSDIKRRWASLKPVGTAVWTTSLQTDEQVTHRALIRFMEGITNDYELVYRGTIYRVKRCAPLNGERIYLVLDLEELGYEEAL